MATGKPKLSGRSTQQHYQDAAALALGGDHRQARKEYLALRKRARRRSLRALVENDLAVLDVLANERDTWNFERALELDANCQVANDNLMLTSLDAGGEGETAPPKPSKDIESERIGVAIVSFLFNWPSTGGGIVHTVELAQFLSKAGFAVHHVYAENPSWGVGTVAQPVPFESVPIAFDDSCWTIPIIQKRFRQAIDRLVPDYVIITDSWNSKPLLADALSHYRCILRLQAQECICPLNNVRLLCAAGGGFTQCSKNQLATPKDCHQCLLTHKRFSGGLHQADRTLCAVGSEQYDQVLRRALADAHAVLVVNPLIQAAVEPYAKDVRVVTAGMDPARFAWPPPPKRPSDQVRLLFAGLAAELMKGFGVLRAACQLLWSKRQDFELLVTSDQQPNAAPWERYVGWQSQADLPDLFFAADIAIVPTIAQEALGRTAVEAMAAGLPVVASRIGGLPFTVLEEATGLLAEPADVADLAEKIERLISDPQLRCRLGAAGRRRFEDHYSWDVIIRRHYMPLLCAKRPRAS